jgi:hypothetical protein
MKGKMIHFTRPLRSLIGMALLALTLGSVGTGCGSTMSEICQRAAECNLLRGESAAECAERNERITDQETSAERHDIETKLQDCLDLKSCDRFSVCAFGR